MQLNSLHLIYFSPTHTSRQVARAVAKGTGIPKIAETDLTRNREVEIQCDAKSLVVVAVPVYGGRVAETAIERLQRVRGAGSPVILIAVYGNRDYEDALRELADWSREQGFVPVGAGAFIGEHSYSRPDKPIAAGRPDEKDRMFAFSFGQKVMENLERYKAYQEIPVLTVKGNYPYKMKGTRTLQAPDTLIEKCIHCGLCVEVCPVGAIEPDKEMFSNAELCIKCCACVKECPEEARLFETPYTDLLFKNFSARREPELFYIA